MATSNQTFSQINVESMISGSEGIPECRVCLESSDNENNRIIAPCKCEGSVKYIHVECLKKWVRTMLKKKSSRQLERAQKEGIPC